MQEDESAGRTFALTFVRASGKEKGALKTVAKALYGAPNPKKRGDRGMGESGNGKVRKTHLDAGTLPCTDTETGTYFTPLISHIVGFNEYQVIH